MTATLTTDQTTSNQQEPEEDVEFLANTPVKKALLHLSIPTATGMLAGTVYNIINAAFVGHTGDTTLLAALTFSLPLMALGGLFGVGVSSFVSRSLGEKKFADARGVAPLAIWGPVGIGVLIAVLGLSFLTPVSHFLGADATSLTPPQPM
ncbi:MAG: MATE family efflux transporter [Rothia sp. (in: high G+C Gram-positive bacteria)]|nr:MATE family efflux transporter [Rothia sp. (in: high G+C Gram-positive bacteria)]